MNLVAGGHMKAASGAYLDAQPFQGWAITIYLAMPKGENFGLPKNQMSAGLLNYFVLLMP